MTATERAKRSDALYYETVSVTRRVLCDMIANREADLEDAKAESAKLREEFNKMDVWHSKELTAAMAENAKLREQMERLVTLLRVDCDIDASWDGLRRFWSIGLTEDGCLMRDRACKAEAENAKLLELVIGMHMAYVETLNECESLDEGLIWECSGNIDADVAKSRAKFKADRHRFDAALRDLGVEVDA